MNKISIFIVTLIFISLNIAEAEEVMLTLEEAIALSLRNNRDILLKAEDLAKAKLRIAEAKAELFPSLNFYSTYEFTRGLYLKDIPSTSTQLTLKQYLYNAGKTVNTIAQNEYKTAIARALLDKAKIETVLEVEKAFYAFALAHKLAKVNKGILENTKAHLGVIESRYLKGEASNSDIMAGKGSLAGIEQAYALSLNQIDSGGVVLRYLLAIDKDVPVIPRMEFIYEPVEVAYDQAFLKAVAARPEIKQYEAQENADKKAIEIARSGRRPSVYASWDYYSNSTTSLTFSPRKGWQDYNVLGVTFSWPIFDGFATQAKIQQAIVDLKATRLSKEKTERDIALELKSAYLALKNALLKMKFTQAQSDLYKDTLEVTRQKYKKGVFSSLDLDDATLGYGIAQFDQEEAVYDYLLAKAKFEKATGGNINAQSAM